MKSTPEYFPESSLGWLDFDSAASERVGELLRAFEEPGTLDVLGLGTVRDAFSEMLSPGTSTVQTRLRYFIFVPWIFKRLEEKRLRPVEFSRRLRDDEARLIDCLRLGGDQGVIGYRLGRNLKTMPSALYWSGLRKWGLRRLDWSIGEYARRAATLRGARPERDDDGNPAMRSVSMWAELPPAPDDFLRADLNFDLGPGEAQVLVDHIRRNHPGSLLAVLCATPLVAAEVAYPWELPERTMRSMSPRLADILQHAQNFSEVTLGPQLVYNLLLVRRARAELDREMDELEADLSEALMIWTEWMVERLEEVRSWGAGLPEFWSLLSDYNVGPGVREFVGIMVKRIADDPEGFADDPAVEERICARELRLKSNRARLTNRSALENWNGTRVGGEFDFRWGITRSYLNDIAASRESVA
ncbi:MAG: hypothetical protein F4003_12575 [Acidimicrobiaceae bacterium]|nr:hypothetical protein [Acidimicrobiaceae bacterium]MYC42078.1 hypothetical protein [Acidimicrobiaceae bacterium]